jgi:hypothetical protein
MLDENSGDRGRRKIERQLNENESLRSVLVEVSRCWRREKWDSHSLNNLRTAKWLEELRDIFGSLLIKMVMLETGNRDG